MVKPKNKPKRKGVLIAVAGLALWVAAIVLGNLQDVMTDFSAGDPGSIALIGFIVLGFPFACGAAYYLLARLITLTTGRPGGRYFFAGLILLIGVGSLGLGVWETIQGLRSASFPSVEGTILTSQLRVDSNTSRSSGSSSRKTAYTYDFEVTYQYTVGGKSYQGKEYDVSSGSLPREEAAALPDRYPAGSAAKVYYDPGNPGTAYLKPGLAGTWFLLLIVGGLLTALGTFALRWLEKQHGAARTPTTKNQD